MLPNITKDPPLHDIREVYPLATPKQLLGCVLLLCIGMLPWLATSTAHAAADITYTLSASGAKVGDAFGYRVGQSIRLARRVTGSFTLEITFSERITGLGNNHFSFVGGTFTTPQEDSTNQKVWKTTITPTSTAAFQINAFLGSSPTIEAADNSGDTLAAPTTKVLLVYHDLAPTFSAATQTLSIAEGTTTSTDIATLAATDGNSDHTVTYAITAMGGGADGARFTIAGTGNDRLRFVAVPNFENPISAAGNNEYIVIVTASSTSPSGSTNYQTSDTDNTPYTLPAQTATQTFTITVTDVNEPPSKPAAPTVTAANATPTQLSVTWSAPANTGPAITDYDVQYRAGTSGGFTSHAHTGTTRTATITGLTPGTAYQVQVRATNDEGTGDWSESGSATTAANDPPAFDVATTAFNVAENSTTVTTASATDADTVVTDVVSYAISGGADSAKFSINASSGAVTFTSAPDFENPTDVLSTAPANAAGNNEYIVIVTASSGANARALSVNKTLIVTVTDVNEPPSKPDAPMVTAAPATPTELSVSWSAPTNTGKPAITDYDVQYRAGTSGVFTSHAHTGTTTEATITGLTPNTAYQVQVLAKNAEGTGLWSNSGTATTAANDPPVFSSSTTAFDVAENSTAVTTASATDADTVVTDVVSYAISGGADSAKFSINASSGAVTFTSAPDFEDAQDVVSANPSNAAGNNEYIVIVTASSGTGARALSESKTLTVTVTDVNEPPSAPAAPTVRADDATPTELSVTWSAPTNTGKPAISDYDVQYRAGTSGGFTNHPHTGTTREATITGLTPGTLYQVQVLAKNDEGTGTWSASGSATTAANVAPVFSSAATASVPENTTAVLTVQAADSDASDSVTGYAMSGTDSGAFTLNGTTGVLTFSSAPDFENPTDAAHTTPAPADAVSNNKYIVFITATSGTGGRALTKTQRLTITVRDVNIPPKLAAPGLTAMTLTSVSIQWTAPADTGLAITGYDVRYRQGSSGAFTDAGFTGTGTATVLTGLTQHVLHEIQVRATNAEGSGPWSDAVSAVPQDNDPPVFSSSAAVTVAENTPADTPVVTVVARDGDPADEIMGYTLSGTDSGAFTFDASSGVLRFRVSPDYGNPLDVAHTSSDPADAADAAGNNTYIVFITVTSGTGDRRLIKTQRLAITVTAVDDMSVELVLESSVALTDDRRVTSEPSWTVTFDFSKPLAAAGDGAFSVSDINVSGTGTATFGEVTRAESDDIRYTVPVTVSAEGTYTFQVKRGSVATAAGDTYGGAAPPLVVIYNTPPVITDVTVVPPPATGYIVGSELSLELTFDDDNVDIPANVDITNRPYIVLYLGERTAANQRRAYWQSARDANSTVVTFAYEVQSDDVANVVHWEPRLVVPETAPITNGVRAIVTGEPADTRGVPVSDAAGIVAFPGETTQPAPGQPQEPVAPLTQEVPVLGAPVVFLPPTETVEPVKPTQIPRTPLIFNELGNGAAGANDWLELRNVTAEAVPLKNWGISIVADGEKVDKPLVRFPSDAAFSIPPKGLLLITRRPPEKTRLAGGIDITQPGKTGAVHHYFVAPEFTLPDDGQFLLILRNAKGKLGTGENVIDVAGGGGPDTDAFISDKGDAFQTDIWPLQATAHPREDTASALGEGKVWRRAKADSVGYHKDAWTQAAYTGVGYDRVTETSPATAGTPGYPNDAVKPVAATPRGSVTFSELMVDSADGKLPQWIELYNASKTEALNLNRWKLELQNVDSEDLVGRPVVTLTLKEKVIQPNQTLLIVAGPARASSDSYLPTDRVYDLLALHEKNLRIKTARDTFLSTEGFYLKLTDRNGHLVDEVGNRDSDRHSDDAPAWALPLSSEEGSRSSVIRRYTEGTSAAKPGQKRSSWVLAARVKKVASSSDALYWGDADDIGTPGHRRGGALPVELSSFSMTRTEAGAVVLTWTTESEVDNAGFNLRRSEKRDSGFTLLNPALIAGAGTTGERQTYTFTDTSAKPGIEYYYQIEEVASDGKRETLAMRLLRGSVSAANRMLTTFGEVKRQK